MKNIYDLDLHERTLLEQPGHSSEIAVIRVPGGWIYLFEVSSISDKIVQFIFIPYSDEFNPYLQ
jgi:hypothetical protein